MSVPRSGYTLPVFACAAAIAACRWLKQPQPLARVEVNLLEPDQIVEIAIEQVAGLKPGMALAITRSDPGDNLDLTRHTPLWAIVEWGPPDQEETIRLIGGEGIGKHQADGQAAIYRYARRLMQANLQPWLAADQRIQVTLVLPAGRQLAERTSNAAFGVVEGLSLLGTSGISHPLSAPEQLETFRAELQQKRQQTDHFVFCIGENGLALAQSLGIQPATLVKTANWLGPLLVEAATQQAKGILLFGYHGKLLKLAGGIFHTHHYVADGRTEILTAHCAQAGLPTPDLQTIFASATAEAGLAHLQTLDRTTGSHWVEQVYGTITEAIDARAQTYIQAQADWPIQVGSMLFDRQRQIIARSKTATLLLGQVLLP